MAQRGKASIAHEFNERGVCVHCDMYEVNVKAMNHVCKPWRESFVDNQKAEESGLTLAEYRLGDQGGERSDSKPVED